MDIESIGFAIQTTVVGMLIVFGFLSFLAVTMVLLARLFKDGTAASVSGGSRGASADDSARVASVSSSSKRDEHTESPEIAGVVVAAAAAFIEHEQRSSEASAAPWSGVAR